MTTTTIKKITLNAALLLAVVVASAQTGTKKECEAVYSRDVIVAVGECQGEEVLLDAGSFTNTLFSWDLDNDGLFEVEQQTSGYVQTTFNVAGLYPVKAKLEKKGCQVHVIEEAIQIKASKTPSFKVEGTCQEISLQRVGSSNDSSIWNLSNGVSLKGDTVHYEFPENSGKFEIELASYIGDCVGSAKDVYEFERVFAKPSLELSSQCAPSKLTVQNATSKSTESYTWTLDGKTVSIDGTFDMDFTEAVSHELHLEVRNGFGCKDRTAEALKIDIAAPLVSQLFPLDSVVCDGTPVRIDDRSTGFTHRKVLWGDGAEETTLKALEHEYAASGVYEITTVLENRFKGCADTLVYKNAVVVAEKPEAAFEFTLDGTCVPQLLDIKNLSNGNYHKATLLLNAYDTIDFENTAVIKAAGRHELRLQVENTDGGCVDEHIMDFTLRKPFTDKIAPYVLETKQDSAAFEFSWKGFPNTEYFEIYKTINGGEALLATTTDTVHRILKDAGDSTKPVYSVRAVDQCEAPTALSPATRGIELLGSYQTDSFPTLQWNAFEAWGEQLTGYEIERNTGSGWEKIGTSFQPHFIDRNYDHNNSLKATYRVAALNSKYDLKSVSTDWTFEFEPNIFIPSAFSPNYDNLNDVYEIKGFGMEKLDVQIFNSFGQRVFDSKGEIVHWDGTYKGDIVEEGAYLAVVHMVTPNGAAYEYQRSVTVVK